MTARAGSPLRWLAGALVVVVFLLAWAQRAASGRALVAASDAALERADLVEAILLARGAAEARCPLCSAPELGFARLSSIAADAEDRGDAATAIAAWRAARAAALGTALLDPAPRTREGADAQIARLEHRLALSAETPYPGATDERLRAALASPAVPSGVVFAFVALGAALFLAGAVRFARAPELRAAELALAAVGGAVAAVGVLAF